MPFYFNALGNSCRCEFIRTDPVVWANEFAPTAPPLQSTLIVSLEWAMPTLQKYMFDLELELILKNAVSGKCHFTSTHWATLVGANSFARNLLFGRMNSPLPPRPCSPP